MARTKHRKDHQKAVAHRRLMATLSQDMAPPRPVKVGKNKFQIVGGEPQRPTTPEEIAALPVVRSSVMVEEGTVVLVTDGQGHPFYARVSSEGMEGMQEIGLNGRRLRGRQQLLGAIDDASHYQPPQEVKALVDGREVPAKLLENGAVLLDTAPPEDSRVQILGVDWARPGGDRNANLLPGEGAKADGQGFFANVDYAAIENALIAEALKASEKGLEYIQLAKDQGLGLVEFLRAHDEAMLREFAVLSGPPRFGMSQVLSVSPEQLRGIENGKFPEVSMGCTAEPPLRGPSRPLFRSDEDIVGLLRPEAHVEMAFTKGPDGKLHFEEVSLCPGPDPNGITDLKDPE